MTEKIISLLEEWLSECREIILLPRVRENIELFSQNAREIFRHNVMLGLISWRKGIDPTSYFNEAINDIISYRDDLLARGVSSPKLHLDVATLIGSLVEREGEFMLDCDLDGPSDVYLDCVIAKRIQGDMITGDVGAAFSILSRLKRQALAVRTYEVYFKILEGNLSGPELEDLVRSAEMNYSARSRDSFYSGGPDIVGGGEDNAIVVDYILGAILKNVNYTGDSIHRWKW